MTKDIIENKPAKVDKNQQIHTGYAIELKRKNLEKGKKFYLSGICAVGPDMKLDYSVKNPRTLVYITEMVSPGEDINGILFFDNKMDTIDMVTMIKVYQEYDEKLCGPIEKGYKFIPKVVKIKSHQKYSDLQKDFLDINNHMDFNLEQDKAKKWIDEYIAKAKEKSDA